MLRSIFLYLKDKYKLHLIYFNSWKCRIFYGMHWTLVVLALSRPGKIQRLDFTIYWSIFKIPPRVDLGFCDIWPFAILFLTFAILSLTWSVFLWLINHIYSSKCHFFILVIQWIALPASISLISALCYSLPLILECSYFLKTLKYIIRIFIWDSLKVGIHTYKLPSQNTFSF